MRDFELDPAGHRTLRPEPDAAATDTSAAPPFAGTRSAALDATTVMHLQRTAGNQGVLQMLSGEEEASAVHDIVGSGGGTPLDDSTRGTMESAFGTSFENVRVHTDDRASQSAESVGANAYTVGLDVVFKAGQYDPGSAQGQRTLAHELAHVVQQSRGPVDGTDAPGGIRVSDPSDRFERAADQTAGEVMSSVQTSRQALAAGGQATAVQLEEDEPAMPAVQRQEDEEEEEMPSG
jgi:hypothetical protein